MSIVLTVVEYAVGLAAAYFVLVDLPAYVLKASGNERKQIRRWGIVLLAVLVCFGVIHLIRVQSIGQ